MAEAMSAVSGGLKRRVFVNLPVKDLPKSTHFFTKTLGFTLHEPFSNDKASCIAFSEHIYAMLLLEPFFKSFTKKELVDGHKGTEAIVALELESKQRVDEVTAAALSGGGSAANETNDSGFMYGRSFHDPDGHLWEFFWMDPKGVAEHVAKEKAQQHKVSE